MRSGFMLPDALLLKMQFVSEKATSRQIHLYIPTTYHSFLNAGQMVTLNSQRLGLA